MQTNIPYDNKVWFIFYIFLQDAHHKRYKSNKARSEPTSAYLNRCRPACHCSQLIVSSMASKFHQYIHLIFLNNACNFFFINPINISPDPTLFQDSLPKPDSLGICLWQRKEISTGRRNSNSICYTGIKYFKNNIEITQKALIAISNQWWHRRQYNICQNIAKNWSMRIEGIQGETIREMKIFRLNISL